ncbi:MULTISPECIES: VWA domain-containing protein [Rhodomicrobium]|uniref:vWA domain-containing protein n=1 Tax=Rhodomicrobium TaxID=1068 RepID=UPI000B4B9BD7|nr:MULTISPECIES: VWA domain-containing protein [Rhodomicrobium]
MRLAFIPAFVTAGLLALPGAQAAPAVKLRADLGQSVLPEGQGGMVYLRVGLEGVAPETEGARIPANVLLVIDKSGSMKGDRIDQAKEAALMAVERLGSQDVLGVVTYSDNAYVLSPAAKLRDTGEIRGAIRRLKADGRTALYAGVSQGIRELRPFIDAYKVNRVILLSDGMANVGPSTPGELEALGREAAEDGVSITTIGLGLGYNEDLMTRLALASDGNHAFVEKPGDLVTIFNEEFGDVLAAVGGDVEIIIDCPEGFEPVRVLGREAKVEGDKIRLKMNQIYGKQEKYVVVELKVDGARAKGAAEAARVEVNYTDLASKTRATAESRAALRFSPSASDAKASLNKDVMAAVTTQIATERNEKAVSLRDSGKTEEAKKMLRENAAYLKESADQLPAAAAAPLRDLSERNLQDAENLSSGEWDRTRKSMRAQQYKDKTQQRY